MNYSDILCHTSLALDASIIDCKLTRDNTFLISLSLLFIPNAATKGNEPYNARLCP